MNIIKIKDIIINPTDSGLTQDRCDLFNTKFRGKYVYCIDWCYIALLEDMTESDVITASRKLVKESDIREESWMSYDEIKNYVDIEITTKLNNVDKYREFNRFIASDITLDQLKKFRTWLASTLLTFDIQDSKTNHMLSYYANRMYDNTVEALSEFGVSTPQVDLSSPCGCNSIAQTLNINVCDLLTNYRRGIYQYMISIFSQIDFWMDFDPEFIEMFKRYIDGILQHDLPLHNDEYSTNFVDCTCQLKTNTVQELNRQILVKLSKSLQYIKDDEIKGNRNYIATSFKDWATHLYERMEW